MSQKQADQIKIFDTTLRDGEQSPGASMTLEEKLKIAEVLEAMKVDIIEAGFAIASNGDFECVKKIAEQIKDSTVCSLARAALGDIDRAAEALKPARNPRIHTFIATSPLHMKVKLQMEPAAVLEAIHHSVSHARRFAADVEWSAEDATRTDLDFLCKAVDTAIKAGATTINLPDTVGYGIPEEYAAMFTHVIENVANSDKAIFSTHCHNDLGLAVANSLAAVNAGARQVECTINGIGERAGNASLEEIAMILQTRKNMLGFETNINSAEISRTSKLVSQLCNMPVQANKAIVGANAFSHSSGIHQDGVLKAQNTYEIMTPESVGINKNNLNLTSRSGRHVIKHRLTELGYKAEDYDLEAVYDAFLKLADKKGQVYDYDLEALLFFDKQKHDQAHFQLLYLQANSGREIIPSATVKMKVGTEEITQSSIGNGPVDAAYKAIMAILGHEDLEVVDFKLDSKGEGADALAQVSVIATYKGRRFHGIGLATDIVEAGVKALIFVLNNTYLADKIDQQKNQQERVAGV
jgi:2-isopropylmalate synthase